MPEFSAFGVQCRFFGGDERRCVLRFDDARQVVQLVVDEKALPESFYAGKLLCAFASVGYATVLFAHFRDGSAPLQVSCATERERDLLIRALNGARDGDYSALQGRENGVLLCHPVRVQGRVMSSSREATLVSSRLLLHRNASATLPLMALSLEEAELDKPKPDALSVKHGSNNVVLRFSDSATADKWLTAITKAVIEVKNAHVAAKAERRRAAAEANRRSSRLAAEASAEDVEVSVGEHSGAAGAAGARSSGRSSFGFADIVRQAQNRSTLLAAWGENGDGQLGGGARGQQCSSIPAVVRALRNTNAPEALAAGERHCVAVTKQGAAFAWGAGGEGQLGIGPNCRQSTRPFLIAALRSVVVQQVACGRAHTLALAQGGALWGWGANAAGQLGTGSTSAPVATPRRLNSGSDAHFPNVRTLAAGGDASAALAVDGAVFAWGIGRYGQLGRGDCEDALQPIRVRALGTRSYAHVALGSTFALAVAADGRVWQWGRMIDAKEEEEEEKDESEWASPQEVAGFSAPVRTVSAGSTHAVALACADSTIAGAPITATEWFGRARSVLASEAEVEVYQWGAAADPAQVKAQRVDSLCGKQVIAVAAGRGFSLAVTASGGLFAWGELSSGQAGNGSFDSSPQPQETPTIVELGSGMQLSPLIACGGRAVVAIAVNASALQQPGGKALAARLAAKWRHNAAAKRVSQTTGGGEEKAPPASQAASAAAMPSPPPPPPPPSSGVSGSGLPPPPPPPAPAAASTPSGGVDSLPPPPPPPPPPSTATESEARSDRGLTPRGSVAQQESPEASSLPSPPPPPPTRGAAEAPAPAGDGRTESGESPLPAPPGLAAPPAGDTGGE